MPHKHDLRYVLAGYGFPAEYALYELFASGVMPAQVLVLTHAEDSRNAGFIAALKLRSVAYSELDAKQPEAVAMVEAFAPDIIISMHYRQRIPGSILRAAKLGAVNLHPSLLPKYRGTNSVPWTIIHGETETGFTFHYMEEDFDTGHILVQERLAIRPQETAFSLFHRQILAALPHLATVIDRVAQRHPGHPQEGEPSYFPRQVPHDGLIDPAWDEAMVERYIRAMIFPPFAPAKLEVKGVLQDVASMDEYRRLMREDA
jgi:methionyl-tRNA formyltransferase